ncbi:MAG: hypothetical protein ABI954_10360 [Pyrinomonadaceae bacterium]
MKIHLKIIAFIHLFMGCGLLATIIFVTSQYFLVMGKSYESSVLDADATYFQQLVSQCNFYADQYQHFSRATAMSGFKPLYGLIMASVAIGFGIGLLKYKEWARKLGFVIIALNILEFAQAVANSELTILHILVIGLTGYMLWTFLSEDVRNICKSDKQAQDQ